jgi:hypothetical protein
VRSGGCGTREGRKGGGGGAVEVEDGGWGRAVGEGGWPSRRLWDGLRRRARWVAGRGRTPEAGKAATGEAGVVVDRIR